MNKLFITLVSFLLVLSSKTSFAVIHQSFTPVCSATLTANEMCRTTPDKFQITIYEMGLCESNPYGTTTSGNTTFDSSTCSVTFTNSTGFTTDVAAALASGTPVTMTGTDTRPKNGTYKYPYMLMGKVFTTRKTMTVGGVTYYNKSDGGATQVASDLADYAESLNTFAAGCDPYYINSPLDVGTISGYLATNAKAIDTTAGGLGCANATRLVGVINLTTPFEITDRTVGLTFTFNLTNNGVQVQADGAGAPDSFGSGPFSGYFTVTNN